MLRLFEDMIKVLVLPVSIVILVKLLSYSILVLEEAIASRKVSPPHKPLSSPETGCYHPSPRSHTVSTSPPSHTLTHPSHTPHLLSPPTSTTHPPPPPASIALLMREGGCRSRFVYRV